MILDNSSNSCRNFPEKLSSISKAAVFFSIAFIIIKMGSQTDFSKITALTLSSGSLSITADLSSAKDSLNLALQNANNLAKRNKSLDKVMAQYQAKKNIGEDNVIQSWSNENDTQFNELILNIEKAQNTIEVVEAEIQKGSEKPKTKQ